ncbi:hypothetical protein ACDA27_004704, partial [Salmonella enterica]
ERTSTWNGGANQYTNLNDFGGLNFNNGSNVTFNALNTSINATGNFSNRINYDVNDGGAGAIVFHNKARVTFEGNATINATAPNGTGILYSSTSGALTDYTVNVKDNAHVTINASGGNAGILTLATWEVYSSSPAGNWRNMFSVGQNATLDINAATTGRTGFPAIASQAFDGGISEGALIFEGAGDVNINATVENGNAVLARYLDNMALTGNLTLTGRSQSGSGIVID